MQWVRPEKVAPDLSTKSEPNYGCDPFSLQNQPQELQRVDVPRLVAVTEGFTGADLKRLIEDGKAIYVYDKSRGAELLPTTDYFLRAVEAVKQNKEHYAAAEAQALMQPKSLMPGFMRSFVHSQVVRADADD